MTPFVKWKINMLKAYNGFFPDDPEGLIRAAWLEATRQAYLNAAQICNELAREGSPDAVCICDLAVTALRAKAKEYDNEAP